MDLLNNVCMCAEEKMMTVHRRMQRVEDSLGNHYYHRCALIFIHLIQQFSKPSSILCQKLLSLQAGPLPLILRTLNIYKLPNILNSNLLVMVIQTRWKMQTVKMLLLQVVLLSFNDLGQISTLIFL